MDLHLHTPASIDYKQPNVTYLDLLKKAEEKNLDVIAFTDHNTATGYARYLEEVESLELLERLGRLRDDERERLAEYRRLQDKILLLPGFEFTATLGFHILGIFPPDTTVRELEHLLLLLRVPAEKLDQGSGEVGATTDALTAYRMISEAGGMAIAAHANSSHGVAMPGFDFGGQTRIAYTQDPNLLALEVTDLESKSRRRTAAFFSGTKPEYPRRMHCIQSSDSHKLTFDARYKNEMGVGDRATEILLDDLSYEAIRDVFIGNDFARTRPYRPEEEEPYDPIREAREQGDTLVQAFHERLHEKRGVTRSILEDVVALANTNGGTIYIGANANVKQAVLGVDRPEQAGVELRSIISKEITPPLEVQVDVVKSQGKNLLQLIVPRGSEAPYALEGTYIYVRSENETGLAMRDEVVQLVRDALAVEFAAAGTVPVVAERRPLEEEQVAPAEAVVAAPGVSLIPPVEPPRTGVEIVSSEVRKGIAYYSVRDLRNNRIVQNVTRASARRLWQYAIEEQEKHTCDPAKVLWIGNIGICKSHKRGGKTRYDLVQRVDGKIFTYYGVTDDGIHGEWRRLVDGETAVDIEAAESEAPEFGLPATEETEGAAELRATADMFEQPAIVEGDVVEDAPSEPAAAQVAEAEGAYPFTSEAGESAETGPEPEAERAPEQEIPEARAEEPAAWEKPTIESWAAHTAPAEEIRPESTASMPAPEQAHAAPLPPDELPPPEHVPAREPPTEETPSRAEEMRRSAEDVTGETETEVTLEVAVEETPGESAAVAESEEHAETRPTPPVSERLVPPPPPARKSRAQEWRELLDRKIAEAQAAQQAAKRRDQAAMPPPPVEPARGTEQTEGTGEPREADNRSHDGTPPVVP